MDEDGFRNLGVQTRNQLKEIGGELWLIRDPIMSFLLSHQALKMRTRWVLEIKLSSNENMGTVDSIIPLRVKITD